MIEPSFTWNTPPVRGTLVCVSVHTMGPPGVVAILKVMSADPTTGFPPESRRTPW